MATSGTYLTDRLRQAERYLADGIHTRAMDICAQIVRMEPDHVEGNRLMAEAVLRTGHASEACLLAEHACKLESSRPELHTLLSVCLLECGEVARARQSAESALELNPRDPAAGQALARAVEQGRRLVRLEEAAGRPLLSASEREALQQNFSSAWRSTPILINSRDRVSHLRKLVEWLQAAGYTNLAIVDNASTYGPLLDYFAAIEREVIVYRLDRNYGHGALWRSGISSLIGGVPFVYTDGDVLPVEECPYDVVLHLHRLLRMHPWVSKAGLGIRIDDLPNTYEHKLKVLAWESRFWGQQLPGNCYSAPIDTTFALYPAGAWHRLEAVRSGLPYLVRHLPWYRDSSRIEPEDQYYADHALPGISSWSGHGIAERYR